MSDTMMVIKQGKFEVRVPRSELVSVDETHDGVTFLFKGGLQLYKSDQFMPIATKNLIKNTADSYPDRKLVFELDNHQRPVYVDAL